MKKYSIRMKLKSNVILTVIAIVAFLLMGGKNIVNAQGFFSDSDNNKLIKDDMSKKDGTLQRDFGDGPGGDPGDGGGFGDGGDGDGKTDEPDGDDDEEPIGGGMLILSLLAGGYTLVKRNVRNKIEDEA